MIDDIDYEALAKAAALGGFVDGPFVVEKWTSMHQSRPAHQLMRPTMTETEAWVDIARAVVTAYREQRLAQGIIEIRRSDLDQYAEDNLWIAHARPYIEKLKAALSQCQTEET